MKTLTKREFLQNAKKYMDLANKGERVVILDRTTPFVEIIPHSGDVSYTGWKRDIKRVK